MRYVQVFLGKVNMLKYKTRPQLRIHAELVDHGEQVDTVARLMRRERIQSEVHRRFVVTTDSRHTKTPAENILARDFAASRANEKWVSDVTFIPTRKGWLYVALIMDLYSRRIVGWSMGEKHTTELIEEALKMLGDIGGQI
jgi:transposase InsO family protein